MGTTWKPTIEDIADVLVDQNPWWTLAEVPRVLARPIERSLGQGLWQRLFRAEPRRYELILGPRRVGKTTVMYQTVKHLMENGISPRRLWWFRLDHPLLLKATLGPMIRRMCDTWNVTDADPAYVFFDELVYANDWDLWLKTMYDEHYPIRVAATSSATAALKNRSLESGVGRWEEQRLTPYLFTEFVDLVGLGSSLPIGPTLHDTIRELITSPLAPDVLAQVASFRRLFVLTGGFPELLVSVLDRQRPDEVAAILESQRILRSDAIERAVYKDIPQAFKVDRPMLLEQILYILAGQATGILSPKNICGELESCAQPTFERYLSYLEQAFLVFSLPNYSGREITVQKRGRKLYFVDGAIRNAALQRGIAPLTSAAEMGVLLENLAASHLYALSVQTQVRLFHWRDGGDEVDLVFNHPVYPMAFEISSDADHSRAGLTTFMGRHPRFKGRCYLVAEDVQPMLPERTTSGVGTLPLDLFLLAVGRQAESALRNRLVTGAPEPTTGMVSEVQLDLPNVSAALNQGSDSTTSPTERQPPS